MVIGQFAEYYLRATPKLDGCPALFDLGSETWHSTPLPHLCPMFQGCPKVCNAPKPQATPFADVCSNFSMQPSHPSLPISGLEICTM